MEHEAKRVKYLQDWSKQRGMNFTNVDSTVRLKKVYPVEKTFRIALEESYKFDYIYPEDQEPITNSFGVGIRHTISLTKKNDRWVVYNDWYTDCFEDALQAYFGEITDNIAPSNSQCTYNLNFNPIPTSINKAQNYKKPYYNRQKLQNMLIGIMYLGI